jgi:hypothetical protein
MHRADLMRLQLLHLFLRGLDGTVCRTAILEVHGGAMKDKQQPDKAKDPSDFPVVLEEELEPGAKYCIECGKTHKTGGCKHGHE